MSGIVDNQHLVTNPREWRAIINKTRTPDLWFREAMGYGQYYQALLLFRARKMDMDMDEARRSFHRIHSIKPELYHRVARTMRINLSGLSRSRMCELCLH